jgi:hypothetical protein
LATALAARQSIKRSSGSPIGGGETKPEKTSTSAPSDE